MLRCLISMLPALLACTGLPSLESAGGLDDAVDPSGRLEGTLLTADGQGASKAWWMLEHTATGLRLAGSTDLAGRFAQGELSPGTWRFVSSDLAGNGVVGTVDILPAGRTTIDDWVLDPVPANAAMAAIPDIWNEHIITSGERSHRLPVYSRDATFAVAFVDGADASTADVVATDLQTGVQTVLAAAANVIVNPYVGGEQNFSTNGWDLGALTDQPWVRGGLFEDRWVVYRVNLPRPDGELEPRLMVHDLGSGQSVTVPRPSDLVAAPLLDGPPCVGGSIPAILAIGADADRLVLVQQVTADSMNFHFRWVVVCRIGPGSEPPACAHLSGLDGRFGLIETVLGRKAVAARGWATVCRGSVPGYDPEDTALSHLVITRLDDFGVVDLSDMGLISHVAFFADGEHLLAVGGGEAANRLWMAGIRHAGFVAFPSADAFLQAHEHFSRIATSPDGQWVAVEARSMTPDRGPQFAIVVARVEDGRFVRFGPDLVYRGVDVGRFRLDPICGGGFAADGGHAVACRTLGRDDYRILFGASLPEGMESVHLQAYLPIDGTMPWIVEADPLARFGLVSPGATHVVDARTTSNGRMSQLFVTSRADGRRVAVSWVAEDRSDVAWSPDGRYLTYLGTDFSEGGFRQFFRVNPRLFFEPWAVTAP